MAFMTVFSFYNDMVKRSVFVIVAAIFMAFFVNKARGQNCENTPVSFLSFANSAPSANDQNIEFVFDSFGKYLTGITRFGATNLRLNIVAIDPAETNSIFVCRFRMHVELETLSGGTTWNELLVYGNGSSSAIVPPIDLLEWRINNACNTPWEAVRSFNNNLKTNGDIEYIIGPNTPGEINPNGACGENVNSHGSYLNNFAAYSFSVDYRIKPTHPTNGFIYKAGVYQLRLKFIIAEDL
jgi:hypothetical protein